MNEAVAVEGLVRRGAQHGGGAHWSKVIAPHPKDPRPPAWLTALASAGVAAPATPAVSGHFETQAKVARAVVSCIAPQIDRAEAARIKIMPPEDLTAHGLAQRGWAVISAGEIRYDSGPRDQAGVLARQALERQPGSGLALRVLAWVAWWHVYHATTPSVAATLAAGIEAATAAIAADPTDHHARRLRAQLNFMNQNAEAGLPELRQAHFDASDR